jgi:hypothetical protein
METQKRKHLIQLGKTRDYLCFKKLPLGSLDLIYLYLSPSSLPTWGVLGHMNSCHMNSDLQELQPVERRMYSVCWFPGSLPANSLPFQLWISLVLLFWGRDYCIIIYGLFCPNFCKQTHCTTLIFWDIAIWMWNQSLETSLKQLEFWGISRRTENFSECQKV